LKEEKKGPGSLSVHLFFALLTWTYKQNKGKYIPIMLMKGLQHPDGKKRIEEDEMSPPLKASIRVLLCNPYPPRSADAIAVPTTKHMETLQIRPRQKPKTQQLVLGKISKPNSTE